MNKPILPARWARLALPTLAIALLAMAGSAGAADDERAIVTTADGEPVRTHYGDCWYSRFPAEESQTALRRACGDTSDSDGDGVIDADDACAATPGGAAVDERGCALDSDNDGVIDARDECPGTAAGVEVDRSGCEVRRDSDGDGVADDNDQCPGTASGRPVNADGCLADDDNDGVGNDRDQCPDTPADAKVNARGCEITRSIELQLQTDEIDFDSARLKPAMEAALDNVIARLQATDAEEQLEIIGYTDSIGTRAYNQELSARRAQAVADYLANNGVDRDSMSISGRGENNPVASNETEAGRDQNRRVVIETY